MGNARGLGIVDAAHRATQGSAHVRSACRHRPGPAQMLDTNSLAFATVCHQPADANRETRVALVEAIHRQTRYELTRIGTD